MSDSIYIGPEQRTAQAARREAERVVNDWWSRIGRPDVRVRAIAAERRHDGSWRVRVERTS